MSSIRHQGNGTLATFTAVTAVLLGVVSSLLPSIGILLSVFIVVMISFRISKRRHWIALLLVGCFAIPYDYLAATGTSLRGLPAVVPLLAGILLILGSSPDSRRTALRSLWDLWLFILWMLLIVLISGDLGGLRELFLWVAAAVFGAGVMSSDVREPGEAAYGLALALVVVGTLFGLAAVLERVVGPSATYSLVPGYVPMIREFGSGFGLRASSFAGHPLRLGTAEMLAIVVCASVLLRSSGRAWLGALACLPLCAAGLLLSGARGGWLGASVGVAAVIAFEWRERGSSKVLSVLLALCLVGVTVAVSPVGDFVAERVSGATSQSSSYDQRIAVLSVTRDVVANHSFVGYGFRQGTDAFYSSGLRLANPENDYIVLLVAGGIPLVVLLFVLLLRSLWPPKRALLSPAGSVSMALLLALVVNIGTYNALTWTFGPTVLVLLVALTRRDATCESE